MAAHKKQSGRNSYSPFGNQQRNVNKVVDAGIALGTLYVGVGILGSIVGAFKK